jgi:hypothetical protein
MLNNRTRVIGWTLAATAWAALLPASAAACPTCFAASDERALHGYYLSTAILSAMPFLLIGLIAVIAYAAKRRAANRAPVGPH